MEAFEAAVGLGLDGIETDVRLSRDGLPVLIHDRVTPDRRPVSELTRREIENSVGHKIPILDEALERFPDILWNVEIKTPEAFSAAAKILKKYQGSRRLLVTSFRHDVVMQAAKALEVDCGLLASHRPADLNGLLSAESPRLKSIVWDYNILDESLLKQAKESGWRNLVYGAVTQSEHDHCVRLALAGLITDYPERASRSK